MFKILVSAIAICCAASAATAQSPAFHPGPLIPEFGPVAAVETSVPIPQNTVFSVAFDVSERAEAGEINRTLASAARFLNMHVEAGMPIENLRVTVVVHGQASLDLTQHEFYRHRQDGADNANASAIAILLRNNVEIHLCGQSAAYYEISPDDLLPGVQMSLSAMTSHALLQQQGFTLNPF